MHNFSVVRTKRNCKQQNCASACAVRYISANEKHAEHSNERKIKFLPKEIYNIEEQKHIELVCDIFTLISNKIRYREHFVYVNK